MRLLLPYHQVQVLLNAEEVQSAKCLYRQALRHSHLKAGLVQAANLDRVSVGGAEDYPQYSLMHDGLEQEQNGWGRKVKNGRKRRTGKGIMVFLTVIVT